MRTMSNVFWGLGRLMVLSWWIGACIVIAGDNVRTGCDFKIKLLSSGDTFECKVPWIQGPREMYPNFHELLSHHRPTYNCCKLTDEYLLSHKGNSWRLDQGTRQSKGKNMAAFRSWATSPFNFATSSPKLKDVVQVARCANTESMSIFHLTDVDAVKRGFTSFYVRVARDIESAFDVYYGTSSKSFAWRSGRVWYFSAHWKNVGGTDMARMQCEADSTGLPSTHNCLKLAKNLSDWVKSKVSFVFEDLSADLDRGNVHQMLIETRNRNRPVRSLHEFRLPNNLSVPQFGLGTGAMDPSLTMSSMLLAKKLKYTLIDTAAKYGNEVQVGKVFSSHMSRPIIETKVWPTELGYYRTIKSLMQSREQLGMPIIDIVLLHWPKCYAEWNVDWMDCSEADPDDRGDLWLDSWRALERLYAEGFVLAIGVSNFNRELLDIAYEYSLAIVPMVVQNEFALDRLDLEVIDWCRIHGALYQGYAVFRQGFSQSEEKQLVEAMRRDGVHQTSPREYLMQLILNSGLGFLARSNSKVHLESNIRTVEQPLRITTTVFDIFGGLESVDVDEL